MRENISKRSFIYGKTQIEYSLLYVDRKTMEIAVHPDCAVVVKVPLRSDTILIEAKLHKRARWIIKQINYFKQFSPKTPSRSYVNGESHLYLGKKYRLKITQGIGNSVKLSKGLFNIVCSDISNPELINTLLRGWYLEKAHAQFNESFERCWPKFRHVSSQKPNLSIKKMKKRWGSLSTKGTLTLNTELIKAPKECIDYVVIHELCHLKYHDHSSEFYRLLDSVIPGWEKVKHKLEFNMS